MAAFAYAVLALAMLATLFFVNALMPSGAGAALVISAWLLAPYALLALALRFFARDAGSLRTYAATAIATAIGGVAFLAWVIYVRPDAQGAIAVMFTPLYQMAASALLVPLCRWIFGRRPS
jgi:hypothetical protein